MDTVKPETLLRRSLIRYGTNMEASPRTSMMAEKKPGQPPPSAEAAEHTEGGLYPIGLLARKAGVSTRTVRYYEEIGLLETARRYAGGRRVFEGDALERLRFIGRLKRLGFPLEEIRELNEVFALHRSTGTLLVALERKLSAHLQDIGGQMANLVRVRKDLTSYRARIQGRLQGIPGKGTPSGEKP